jgi:hypothetical protein
MSNYFEADTATALQTRLERIQPTTQAQWGTMSAHEMLVHLRDGVEIGLGLRQTQIQGSGFFRSPLGRWLALGFLPWQQGVATPREMDRAQQGSPLADFATDKALLQQRLLELGKATRFSSHPFFGDLNKQQWGQLTAKHLDHHLRQFGC